ncbi:hypothetical protein OKW42_006714 [Paraburkholderia sp. WC7.3d]
MPEHWFGWQVGQSDVGMRVKIMLASPTYCFNVRRYADAQCRWQ